LFEQGVAEIKRREQAGQIDQQHHRRFSDSEAQVDREGWLGTGGQDVHRLQRAAGKPPYPGAGQRGGECQHQQGNRVAGAAPGVAQQAEQERSAE